MNRLKELRQEKKLSQKEIANFLGVNEKTISRWEKNESTIKSDKAQKLADYFGVSVSHLLGYSDNFFNEETSKINKSLSEGIELADGTFMNREDFKNVVLETEVDEDLIDFGKTRLVSISGPTPSNYWDSLGDDFFRMIAVAPLEYVSLISIWSLMTKEQRSSILKMLRAFDINDND